jgi:proliferating cell nuclear antigen PCNA
MNITIKNQQKAEIFGSMFQHIKVFSEHINIMFEKERMYLQSMDSSRVSIFEFLLPSSWFDKYEHTNSTSIPIGINSNILFKILNTREKLQEINIVFDLEKEDTLFINFASEEKSTFDKKFELPLVDIDCESMMIPDMESNAEFTIDSLKFATIINQLKLFGDTIDIECKSDKIQLYSLTETSGKMLVDIGVDDLSEYAVDENDTIQLSFSLNIMHNICLYHKITKNMKIAFIKNYPMKLIYYLDDNDENAKLTFYLAPKINDD